MALESERRRLDTLTMQPDARRKVVRMLAEIDGRLPRGTCSGASFISDVVEQEQLDRAALPRVEVVVLGGGREHGPRRGEVVLRPPDRETDERVGPCVLERVRLDRALPSRRGPEPMHRVDQILLVLGLRTVDRNVVEHPFPFLRGAVEGTA